MSEQQEREPFRVPRLDEQQREELARRIVQNRVFVALSPEQVDAAFGSFLMLMTGGLREQGESLDWLDDVGLIYEDYGKEMGMAVNGSPSFMSAKFVHWDDRIPLQRRVLEMLVAIGSAEQALLDDFDRRVTEREARPTQE